MTTGDVAREYQQAVEQAAVFDLSSRSKIELTGPEALMFLHNLCTQDVKNLPSGAGCEAFLTNAKARVIAHVLIGHYGGAATDDSFILLDTVAGQGDKILQHLDHFLISEQVELADRTTALGEHFVCGPEAEAILQEALGQTFADLKDLHNRTLPPFLIRRNDGLGLPGFDVFCPTEMTAALWAKLIGAGASAADEQTWEILRIEAGFPLFGPDIDDNRLAMEVGRPRAISYTKGCYLGQETIVMARDRGHVNRMLARLRIEGEKAAAPGSKIFHQDQEVGHVTSSAVSPRLGAIALAYLRRGSQEPDKELKLEDSRIIHVTPV